MTTGAVASGADTSGVDMSGADALGAAMAVPDINPEIARAASNMAHMVALILIMSASLTREHSV
jgi:hypothetical protein